MFFNLPSGSELVDNSKNSASVKPSEMGVNQPFGMGRTPAGLTGSLGGRACQRPAHQVSCSSPDGGGKREGDTGTTSWNGTRMKGHLLFRRRTGSRGELHR